MATFELYRRSRIGMCLTETLDQMVSSEILSLKLTIQVLIQFDKSMSEALKREVKSEVSIKEDDYTIPCFPFYSIIMFCYRNTYRSCDDVWTFILHNAQIKSKEGQETVKSVKIVACDSKLLTE